MDPRALEYFKGHTNLRFEISNPNYLLIHVYILLRALLVAAEATIASKQPQR